MRSLSRRGRSTVLLHVEGNGLRQDHPPAAVPAPQTQAVENLCLVSTFSGSLAEGVPCALKHLVARPAANREQTHVHFCFALSKD
jgi:hypothetical protein